LYELPAQDICEAAIIPIIAFHCSTSDLFSVFKTVQLVYEFKANVNANELDLN